MKNAKNISDVQSQSVQGRVLDAPSNHWVYRFLPNRLWPYAQLARWDRPIGWQLLMWPCWWALPMALFSHQKITMPLSSLLAVFVWYLFLFALGAIAMRGAGCTWNDLVDHKIDDLVERTRSRPLPSKQVSRRQAKLFILIQCLVGLIVLLQFNIFSIILGILSLVIVVLYPFMKRVTDWPQFFLGLAFNWGALMGWAVIYGNLSPSAILLYVGSILWTIGYDTIYAHQDKEDDALIGVRSTARLFGKKTKFALFLLFSGFIVLTTLAFYLATVPFFAYIGLLAASIHMFVQIKIINIDDPIQCLKLFKSNSIVGLLIFLGLTFGGLWVALFLI